MFNLFKSNPQRAAFGLDISDISLKLVQLEPDGSRYKVAAFSDTGIPKEVMSADTIKDPKKLVSIIRQAVGHPKFGRINTPYVVASIPEAKSFVRVIQMPAMSEEEAAEAIQWEAEQYIPIPVGQVYLDWLILGREGDKMSVLITAAPKEYIDNYVAILKEAGLVPIALEVESQATARSLVSPDYEQETVLIADINTIRTSLIIFDRGTLQFTSSIPIAGNIFTESISRALSTNFEEAEKIKRRVGLDEGEDPQAEAVKKSLLPVLNNLLNEIKNTIRFYEEHSRPDSKITRLLLSGGSSKLKHLPSFLHDKLTHAEASAHPLRSVPGIKVELGNPWVKVLKIGQTPPLSREDSLSFSTAIGLALREGE